MDAGIVHGVWTGILLVAFLAIVGWAFSRRRREDFEAAARLPLEEDASPSEPRGAGDG